MQNKFIINEVLFVLIIFSIAWTRPKAPKEVRNLIVYSLEIGTGILYASWHDKLLTTSNSSLEVSSQYKVSPNMRIGGIIGYEFGKMLAGAFCKWGSGIGLSYGFTRRVRLLDDRGL
jgi:hypothetical protein